MNTQTNNDLFIAASGDSPEVDFRFSTHYLSLKGESYPENAAAFYGDITQRLRSYLTDLAPGQIVRVEIALTYFNSSSTKMLFGLFDALNSASTRGNQVVLNWCHDVDDDTIQEFGAELHDEFQALDFHDIVVDG